MHVHVQDFERLFARALELQQAGDTLGAIDTYKTALTVAPDRPDALSNLGAAYVRLGQFDEALHILEPLIKAAHGSPTTVTEDQSVREALQRALIAAALSQLRNGDPNAAPTDPDVVRFNYDQDSGLPTTFTDESNHVASVGYNPGHAVANATVPQVTIVIGGSFGAGNYGMCGRAYDPRFIFAWPNSRTAVMGGEQAAGVMKTVTEQKFLREGKEPPKAEIDKMFKSIVDQFDRESTALYGTAHLWDDGIIDPRDTRRILAFTLSIARESLVRPLNPITFGVARM